MIYVAPATLFATYAAGQADALLSLGPFALPLVNPRRKSRAILAADYGIVYPSFGLVVKEDSIVARKELIAGLVKVAMRSWKYTYDGHEDEAVNAIEILRPGVKLDRTALLEQLRLYRDFIDTPNSQGQPMGAQNEKDWEAAIKSMEVAGLLKPGHQPREYFTNEFLN
jgi:NitT/TauT family transport system substrate-binding protein